MRNKTLTRPFAIIFSTLLSGTLACDTDSVDAQDRGVLLMKLTDAPIDDVESVFVTFSEVAVQRCVDSAEEAEAQAKKTEPAKKENSKQQEAKDGKDSEDDEKEANDNESRGDDRTDGAANSDGAQSDDAAEENRSELAGAYSDEDKGEVDDGEDEGKDNKKTEGSCEHGVWEVLELGEQTKFDLLTLQNGKTAELGLATLPAGKYGQIRVKLDAAEIVVKGETMALKVPSGMQSGLKIVGGFEVAAGTQTEIIVDFDAGLSVKYVEGNGWMMKPVIRLLK